MVSKRRTLASAQAFPVVALGVGAAGAEALEAFFSHWPAQVETGIAFVLVFTADGEPMARIAERLASCTSLPVCTGEDGMALSPGRVILVPPHAHPAIEAGRLSLPRPEPAAGPCLPMDRLFRSLAQDRGAWAVGILLDGMAADGAQGVAAIQAEGGLTMAQKPCAGAPSSRPVDYQLAPEAMPAQLLAYAAQAFAPAPEADNPRRGQQVDHILTILHHQTGHDCTSFRRTTIQQRIRRRMAVTQAPTLGKYVKYLQHHPTEAEALLLDLLVGVSQFFRDPEAFRSLEQRVIPALFSEKAEHAPIRVWVPGCSTGEEAYAVAILLAEGQLRARRANPILVFASDLDAQAVRTARLGVYPASIAADLTPARLARWFSREPESGGYRISRSIRDLVTFSEQDLLRDPPFSRLDLITCRNLLGHMSDDLQKKLIPLLHHALNPGGRLMLGSAEGIGEAGSLFDVVDAKARLYQRRPIAHTPKSRRPPPRLDFEPWSPDAPTRKSLSEEDFHFIREDLHSAQEEWQSSLEEAQTARAELLSANLELGTRNAELEARVARLTHTQAELEACLAGPGIGLIFLDKALRILRFTPAASSMVNLIPGDVGRPLAHLSTRLVGYDQLGEDAGKVLETLETRDREVVTREGRRGRLRLQPYRNLERELVGVVISLVDAW